MVCGSSGSGCGGAWLGTSDRPAGDLADLEEIMTKKEAEAKVKEINKEGPTWFCPLINKRCVPECINFSKAEAYNKNADGKLRDTKQDDY